MQYYEDKVLAEIRRAKLDVSMVVLNAGVMHLGFLDRKQDEKLLRDTLDCNVYHVVSLLKKFLPGLVSRTNRSGLVVVSSIAGYAPIPGVVDYAASKAFLNHLLYAVENEVSSKHWNKVDILTSTPGVV
jgi:short-subunit dehydrogenase